MKLRLLAALAIAAASTCHAAPKPVAKPKPAAPQVLAPLPIALPPQAQVQFEVDGGEEDVLGMLKSFARGLEEANASKPNAASSRSSSLLSMLADKQVSAILKDVRRLHLVVYEMPAPQKAGAPIITGTMEAPVITTPKAAAPFDAVAFHEKPLVSSGGRRNLTGNFGGSKVRMFDFAPRAGQPRGFGLIVESRSRIIVARSHGTPDLAALGRLIRLGG